MPKLYLLIGGNQGDRLQMIHNATDLIRQRIGSVVACSPIYETEPWGLFAPDETPQGFYNQALQVETPLPPHDALKEALDIEHQLGRRRKERVESLELKVENLLPQSNQSNNQAIKQSGNHKHTPVFDHPSKEGMLPHPDNSQFSIFNFQLYSSRPIDIDLIFYDNLVIDTPTSPYPTLECICGDLSLSPSAT